MLNKPIHRFQILTEKREKNISSTKKTAWTMNWTQDSLRPSVDFSAWNSKNFSSICDSLLSWTTFPSVHSSLYFSKIWYTLKYKKEYFFSISYRLAWTLEGRVQSESCRRDTQGSLGIVPGFLARLFLANWAWCRNQIQLGTCYTEKSKLTLNVVVRGPPYRKRHC